MRSTFSFKRFWGVYIQLANEFHSNTAQFHSPQEVGDAYNDGRHDKSFGGSNV